MRCVANFSMQSNLIKGRDPIPVKVTTDFRLFGTPVGSDDFARAFFNERLKEVKRNADALHCRILNKHTILMLFSQCVL